MKKIFIIIVTCFMILNINAQTNFNGYYKLSNDDIVQKTAITSFVSNKMLKIDTYIDGNNKYFLLFTFIDDLFNPISSIRYDSPNNIIINDVIYDASNNCYVACGWENVIYKSNTVKCGLLMRINSDGTINWRSNGWNPNIKDGANEYKRVILTMSQARYYAVCGLNDFNYPITNGVIGFYDIGSGALQYMFKPNDNFNSLYNSGYQDLVYDLVNNVVSLVGYCKMGTYPKNMIREQIDLSSTPTPGDIIVRWDSTYQIDLNATSITIDNDLYDPSYYVAGEIGISNQNNLYVAKINGSSFNRFYNDLYG